MTVILWRRQPASSSFNNFIRKPLTAHHDVDQSKLSFPHTPFKLPPPFIPNPHFTLTPSPHIPPNQNTLGIPTPPPAPARGAAALPPPRPKPLQKQSSWSPDFHREEAWLRRQGRAHRRTKSVSDEDVDELRACFELGFRFDSPELDPRLSHALPAYGLYFAVNKHYNDAVSKSASSLPGFDSDPASPVGSPIKIFSPGEDPKTMKMRLRQWAQVVACSVRNSCS